MKTQEKTANHQQEVIARIYPKVILLQEFKIYALNRFDVLEQKDKELTCNKIE